MLYDIRHGIKEITNEEMQEGRIAAGYMFLEELNQNYARFGFSLTTVKECVSEHANFRNSIDIYDQYSFGILSLIDVKRILYKRERIGFYIKKNLFLIVILSDEDNSLIALFKQALHHLNAEKMTLQKVVYSFFERRIYNDSLAMENMGYHINLLEDEVMAGRAHQQFNTDMLSMKKQLLVLHNYYEQLIDIGEKLQENENDLFEEENLRYIKLFTEKVERLSENTQML